MTVTGILVGPNLRRTVLRNRRVKLSGDFGVSNDRILITNVKVRSQGGDSYLVSACMTVASEDMMLELHPSPELAGCGIVQQSIYKILPSDGEVRPRFIVHTKTPDAIKKLECWGHLFAYDDSIKILGTRKRKALQSENVQKLSEKQKEDKVA